MAHILGVPYVPDTRIDIALRLYESLVRVIDQEQIVIIHGKEIRRL